MKIKAEDLIHMVGEAVWVIFTDGEFEPGVNPLKWIVSNRTNGWNDENTKWVEFYDNYWEAYARCLKLGSCHGH